jgi:hypothetical protein
MHKTLKFTFAWCLATIAAAWLVVIAADQNKSVETKKDDTKKEAPEAKEDLDLSKFMRKKLDASTEVLNGLVTQNAADIIQGARTLAEMSAAEKWQVKNDAMYRQFSGEFQRSATALQEAAEKQNFDAAALKWIDVTMKCIECHKFARGPRIASLDR